MNHAYAARKAAGKCTRCRDDAAPGKTLCVAHLGSSETRQREPMHNHKPKATTLRACLRCERTFASEGAHHRLCTPCRQAIEGGSSPERVGRVRGWHAERED